MKRTWTPVRGSIRVEETGRTPGSPTVVGVQPRAREASGTPRRRVAIGLRISIGVSGPMRADVQLDRVDDLVEVEAGRVEAAGVVGRPHRGDGAVGVAPIAVL